MSICLRRREFIAGLGGAVAWPLAARAQQRDAARAQRTEMPVIGLLQLGAAASYDFTGFRQGLKDVAVRRISESEDRRSRGGLRPRIACGIRRPIWSTIECA